MTDKSEYFADSIRELGRIYREIGTATESPRAEWAEWKQYGSVKLWQAVALSVDRQPPTNPNKWIKPSGFDVAVDKEARAEFRERLRIAASHVGIKLKSVTISDNRICSLLELKSFVVWASAIGWWRCHFK